MLAMLDRVVDKVVPRETAGACIPPESCGCAAVNEYTCYHGLYVHWYRSGTSDCRGVCHWNGAHCNYTFIRFC